MVEHDCRFPLGSQLALTMEPVSQLLDRSAAIGKDQIRSMLKFFPDFPARLGADTNSLG